MQGSVMMCIIAMVCVGCLMYFRHEDTFAPPREKSAQSLNNILSGGRTYVKYKI